MRSFMATATQDANSVWSVRAVEAVTATDRSPPELSQQLANSAHDEGFTVGRAAVEATLQKLYEALTLSLAKLEAAFMALYLSTKETGAQAQLDKLNSLVQAYFAHTEGGAGCHHGPVRVVCEAAVGAAKADGLRVESLLDICGGEIGSESFLRFKHLFASVPMNSDQVDQWGISTLNGVRHRTKIANQLSHAVKNTLKNMPLLYELTERRPTASARDVAVNHLAPLTIARALARINTHSLPKSVSEAFSPITMENNKKGNKKRAADTELDEGGQRGAKWRKRNHQAGEGKKRPRETTAVAPTTHHTDQRQRTALPAPAAATAADHSEPTHKYNTRSKKRKVV
ncbi:unnamed protein product [Vitrella brassicaformis CCMP3155]|uniref:Uncharacterized protein n=1 Tax=Vitrella brassicaformis (strain CCMP3155) TaxID=1169540 RepID=A0A0G4FLX2_VITBC|nr:unnamed protein product [Vitrella brassicaformis CCMP3155]|eukprot:CEM14928.1 unnamed protein product [Vitrella brassicaformis CCMP3155]